MLAFITLDSLINGSTNWLFEALIGLFFTGVLPVAGSMLAAPFTTPGMIWIVTPLLISMTLMQLYYGRHRTEELGWNSAFGNSVALIFVSVNLSQVLYNRFGFSFINLLNPPSPKIWVIIGIGLVSLVQLLVNYFHAIPKKIAFFINSSIPTNITAYIAIVLVYTDIALSFATMIASITLLIVFIYSFRFMRKLVPMSKESLIGQRMLKMAKEREEMLKQREGLRQERAADASIKDAIIVIGSIIAVFFVLLVVNSFIIPPVWINLLVQGVAFIVITALFLIKHRLGIFNLNLDGDVDEVLLGLVIGIPLFIFILGFVYLMWFFVPPDVTSGLLLPSYYDPGWPNFLLLVLLVPISSELIFRGIVQRSVKAKFGDNIGVITQAALFSLITFSFAILSGFFSYFMLLSIPVFFVAGLILGMLRDKWGLECSMATHVSFNFLGMLAFFLTLGI
jgi:membrane protease YdiL (CAAX protease family)